MNEEERLEWTEVNVRAVKVSKVVKTINIYICVYILLMTSLPRIKWIRLNQWRITR